MKYIVCDIDGTISKVGARLKYLQQDPPDWEKFYDDCFEDEPIKPIIDMVNILMNDPIVEFSLVFCTGRGERARKKTCKWLSQHVYIYYCNASSIKVLMRPDHDERHDTEVKPELLAAAGITPKNTAFIIEDRNSMVKKWRELGFICIQPAEGDF